MKKLILLMMILLLSLTACKKNAQDTPPVSDPNNTINADDTSPPKNDSDNNFSETWFVNQYNLAKEQYIKKLNDDIDALQDKIEVLNNEVNDLESKYYQTQRNLKERYPADSASLKIALSNAKSNYNASRKTYTDKINALNEEMAKVQAEINSPNTDQILTLVTQNCNITSKETYEYYNQYSSYLN